MSTLSRHDHNLVTAGVYTFDLRDHVTRYSYAATRQVRSEKEAE